MAVLVKLLKLSEMLLGLAMASLPVNLAVPGTRLEVMLAGRPRAATVLPGPPLLTQPARERRERQEGRDSQLRAY